MYEFSGNIANTDKLHFVSAQATIADATEYWIGEMPGLTPATLYYNCAKAFIERESRARKLHLSWRMIPSNTTEYTPMSLWLFNSDLYIIDKVPLMNFQFKPFGSGAASTGFPALNAWNIIVDQDFLVPKESYALINLAPITYTNNPPNVSMWIDLYMSQLS